MTIGEELYSIDVCIVRRECLGAFLLPDVPDLGKGVASTRNEHVVIKWVNADAHNVAKVVRKVMDLLTAFDIPQDASHIAGRSEDPTITDEAAARQIPRMAGKLASYSSGAFSS